MNAQDTRRYRVSMAIQLMDSFTNRPIVLPMLVKCDAGCTPIRKSDGCYVFVDVVGKSITLDVSGHGYHSLCTNLSVRQPHEALKVQRIFLTPTEACSFEGRVTCVYGTAPAGAAVQGCCCRDKRVKRLLADCTQGAEEIQIFTQGEELEGQSFCALSTRNQAITTLQLKSVLDEEQGWFALEHPMQESLRKLSTKLVSLKKTTANQQTGEYFLPLVLNQQGQEQFYLQMTTADGTTTAQELTLEAGERRRWDWI